MLHLSRQNEHIKGTAVVLCSNIAISEAFYARLGFIAGEDDPEEYRMLSNGNGGEIHLTNAVEGWLIPKQNPFGLYFYAESMKNIDELAAGVEDILLHQPEKKPWGMYEFAVSDPYGVLVRVGSIL